MSAMASIPDEVMIASIMKSVREPEKAKRELGATLASLSSGDIAKLAYATNEFLYYEDSNYMPLMFRTVDGTLVSDNEFADMGLYESEENVENGTEHILPFTDYGSDVESACDLEDEEDLEI